MAAQRDGTVVWFNDAKGFGEIEDKQGKRYFAHYEQISLKGNHKTLSPGQRVTFELVKSQRFPHLPLVEGLADNIKPCAKKL